MELTRAESDNIGSYNTERLEVSESQQKTGCNRNMMSRSTDTLRAAGQERGGGGRGRGEAGMREMQG